jgi:capsular exopolysaccharide synthesis family protein
MRVGVTNTEAPAAPSGPDMATQARILQSRSLRERVLAKLPKDKYVHASTAGGWRKILGLPDHGSAEDEKTSVPKVEVKVRNIENTRMLEILCTSMDPVLAAEFVNGLAAEYTEANLESRWNSMKRASEWLTRQLDDLRVKLKQSEDQLQAYGKTSGLMFGKTTVGEEKLKQLQDELSKSRAERIARQSAFEIASTVPVDSIPQVLDSPRLNDARVQLARLRQQYAELNLAYTPDHYRLKRVQAQITEVEQELNRERDVIVKRIDNEYKSALRREELVTGSFRQEAGVAAEQAEKAIMYGIIQREVDTYRSLYDSFLQKTKEAGIASALRASNVRVVDPAYPPKMPVSPDLPFNTAAGAFSGLFLGLGILLVRETLDRSFRAPGEAPLHLRLPELGAIPTSRITGLSVGKRLLALNPVKRWGDRDAATVELVTWRESASTVAESFRGALTSILYSGHKGVRPRVILVTSTARGEGKTTAVSNIGIALAEIHQQVVLIDADLRKPRLHQLFDIGNTWGLTDLLTETTSLHDSPIEALVRPTAISGLKILPSGPSTANISRLLYSSRMSELVERLRSDFDTVLIDTPPMMYVSDARLLARIADAAILVIRAGKTSRDEVIAAKRRFVEDGIPVLGTILNAWDPNSRSRHTYDDYHSYSGVA